MLAHLIVWVGRLAHGGVVVVVVVVSSVDVVVVVSSDVVVVDVGSGVVVVVVVVVSSDVVVVVVVVVSGVVVVVVVSGVVVVVVVVVVVSGVVVVVVVSSDVVVEVVVSEVVVSVVVVDVVGIVIVVVVVVPLEVVVVLLVGVGINATEISSCVILGPGLAITTSTRPFHDLNACTPPSPMMYFRVLNPDSGMAEFWGMSAMASFEWAQCGRVGRSLPESAQTSYTRSSQLHQQKQTAPSQRSSWQGTPVPWVCRDGRHPPCRCHR